MKGLIGSRLGRRFLVTFGLLAVPVIATGWFGIRSATKALQKQTHELLRVASDGAEAQVREFLESLKRTTESRAADADVRSAFESTNHGGVDLSAMVNRVRRRVPEVLDVYCIEPQGRVVGSSSHEILGKDQSSTVELKQGMIGYYPGDLAREPGTDAIRWSMSAPVKNSSKGRTLGVVVVQFDPAALTALTTGKRVLAQGAETQSFRIGETGETYLVNRSGLLLTESRFAPKSILSMKVETEPVHAWVEQGKEVMTDYRDYRGTEVSGASAILEDMGWLLVTEIDFSQVFAPIRALRAVLIGMTIIIFLVAAYIARDFTKRIVAPLQITSEADGALARGQEQQALVAEETLPRDEIGDFIQKRNVRVRELFKHERELLKEQKRRAEGATALESISYSMVHDMRAPLRAVGGFGDLLAVEAGDRLTEAEKVYLDRMKKAVTRMDQLICDMLKYSSLLRAEVALSAVDVSELIKQVVEQNSELKARKADIEIQENVPLLRGNPALLSQCFSALLDNGFRYARPDMPAKVRVGAEGTGNQTRVFVEDNGTGISPQFQQRLFGIFQKGTNSHEGTGISLALVRVAAERMGGQVGVVSEQGKGSRFWIELRPAG